MPPMRRKGDLPSKVCVTCGRPFAWRKRWAKSWDQVRYCSDACRKTIRLKPAVSLAHKEEGKASKRPNLPSA
ncbi:DUF2256 domain-containing protein [Lichenifustis flavocetrariae]|uniref:DUF2256 domain-containing protein n=1 Tax=Lichenifustis flavocetrariae TaxID=2949735 RepID=A0AA41Z124_9HYPH|nr:DUF2256 domain-containing protein [Lichenifustis flavocetrariae]MCW6510890.1 DUF2256 domain-containing protein [Lichenifustis flavocetrariae]